MENDIDEVYHKYFQMVWRICFMYFKGNYSDTEDAVSDVFLKYIEHSGEFDGDEHKKAWLIVTTQNTCKSMLRRFFRRHISLDDVKEEPYEELVISDTMEKILRLPEKQKMSVYLHYYEGYSGAEIAEIYGVKENTVFSWLNRGRKNLEKMLGE